MSCDYGAIIPDKNFPMRVVYVIDDKLQVRYTLCQESGVGRNVQEILRCVLCNLVCVYADVICMYVYV